MIVSEEELAAFVDGECDAAASARIEQAALADASLAARIGAERAMRDRLRSGLGLVLNEAMPPQWEAMIRAATGPMAEPATAPVIDLAAERAKRAAAAPPVRAPVWRRAWIGGAMAASLVLGLFVGTERNDSIPFADENGTLIAKGALADALDTQLADGQAGRPLRMLATFRNADGALCRAFSGTTASGIACHSANGWQLRHLLPGTPAETAQYRQAGSSNADLMAIAQQMAAGDPLDAKQEAQAKLAGWR